MEEKKINKKIAVVSVLIGIIITSIGVAFGYFIWNSTTNTDISFTVEGAVVELSDGSDIMGANLMPVSSYTNGGKNVVKKDIKVKLKNSVTSNVTVDFKLKINSIDSGLNHSSFKYNLVNASGTSVKSGNFSTSKAGDTISLLTLSTSDGSLTTSLTSYTLYIYIDGAMGDNPSSMMNQSFDFSFVVEGTGSMLDRIGNATTVISDLDDGTTGDSGSGVYKVTHSAIPASSSATGSEIPAVTDYRYYGPSPNNYICLDMEGASTCPDKHLYRIIGSIYEEKENTNRIKVIKATPLTDGTTKGFIWDCKVNNGSGSYDNIWATITSGNYSNSLTSGSQLMKLLNSGAWWNGTSGSYYDCSTASPTATTVNFTNYKLNDKAKSYITTSRYYLGGYTDADLITNEMYGYERGTLRVNTDRPLYWEGMVGLMYPSDYGYAAGNTCVNGTELQGYSGECKNKDWLWMTTSSNYTNYAEWQMSPDSHYAYGAFYVAGSGYCASDGGDLTFSIYSVRPVFYLTSSTIIDDGEGTLNKPYILK